MFKVSGLFALLYASASAGSAMLSATPVPTSAPPKPSSWYTADQSPFAFKEAISLTVNGTVLSLKSWDLGPMHSVIHITKSGFKWDQTTRKFIVDTDAATKSMFWWYMSLGAANYRRAFVSTEAVTSDDSIWLSDSLSARVLWKYQTQLNFTEVAGFPESKPVATLAFAGFTTPPLVDFTGQLTAIAVPTEGALHLAVTKDALMISEEPKGCAASPDGMNVSHHLVASVKTFTLKDKVYSVSRSACVWAISNNNISVSSVLFSRGGTAYLAALISHGALADDPALHVEILSPTPMGNSTWTPLNVSGGSGFFLDAVDLKVISVLPGQAAYAATEKPALLSFGIESMDVSMYGQVPVVSVLLTPPDIKDVEYKLRWGSGATEFASWKLTVPASAQLGQVFLTGIMEFGGENMKPSSVTIIGGTNYSDATLGAFTFAAPARLDKQNYYICWAGGAGWPAGATPRGLSVLTSNLSMSWTYSTQAGGSADFVNALVANKGGVSADGNGDTLIDIILPASSGEPLLRFPGVTIDKNGSYILVGRMSDAVAAEEKAEAEAEAEASASSSSSALIVIIIVVVVGIIIAIAAVGAFFIRQRMAAANSGDGNWGASDNTL